MAKTATDVSNPVLEKPYVGYFRVLHGIHCEEERDGKNVLVKKGEIVRSRTDLLKYNSPGAVKFEKVTGPDVPAPQTLSPGSVAPKSPDVEDTLSSMTVEELRKMAEDEEIEVTGLRTKDQLISAIRASK